jgi:amino acid adenylation domain-containing protein
VELDMPEEGMSQVSVMSATPHIVDSYNRRSHGIHNLRSPRVQASPHAYADAVSGLGPLFYDEVGRVWVCTGYQQSLDILTDHRSFSSVRAAQHPLSMDRAGGEVARLSEALRLQSLFTDPPAHTRIRSALADRFTPASVAEQDGWLRQLAEDRLDRLADRGLHGLVDLVDDFAGPLPGLLGARLLRLDAGAETVAAWADAYERLLGSLSTFPDRHDQQVVATLIEALDVLEDAAHTRLRGSGEDLLGHLVRNLHRDCPGREDAGICDCVEVAAANCLVLVTGGYQTLTHLIVGGLRLLESFPDQQRRLRAEPELIGSAIDEFLRLDGSSQYLARRATLDVEIDGVRIQAGQTVIVVLSAANVDPRKFSDARSLRIDRKEGRHLGFGMGRHHCLGAPYAERLARWAILGFLDRFPRYVTDSRADAVVWGDHPNTRCLQHARVRLSLPDAVPATEEAAVQETAAPKAISPHELHMLTVDWNNTATVPAPAALWHHIFEDRAVLNPDGIVLEDSQGSYTYRETDLAANGLAWALRGCGVEPESVIAVIMERSARLSTALLGVAKAGGAFVVTDPRCPPERLRAMLEDAAPRVILTDESTAPALSALDPPARVLVMQDYAGRPSGPTSGVSSGNTAYIAFTSGTSGRPKAIAISHEGLANLYAAQRRVFRITPTDRVLQALSLNFDGCIFEAIMAPLAGATSVIVPSAQLVVGPPLLRTLRERRITVATLTPSMWSALPDDPLPHLRIAAACGERLPATVVARWSAPGRRFLNLYGPAETAVWATWHECQAGHEDPPIGIPVANKRVYVVDGDLQIVPVGHDGELCIGGIGAGRYLAHPELMADRFVRDPFSGGRDQVMYRTGDVCRWRPDGTLEYRGRIDRQLKVRGQRVEPEEVERVLERAPGVLAGAVVEEAGKLTALVVPAATFNEQTVRDHLSAHLHGVMVPRSIIEVASLPRTDNGKVRHHPGLPDCQKVPAPALHGSAVPTKPMPDGQDGHYSDFDTVRWSEAHWTWHVAKAFAQCLSVPQHTVKADSDFFSVGGDSLATAQLLTRIEEAFQAPVDVEGFLDDPTPAGIVSRMLRHRSLL